MTQYKSLLQFIGNHRTETPIKEALEEPSLALTVIMNNTMTLFRNFINTSSKLFPYLKDEGSEKNLVLITGKVTEAISRLQELDTEVAELPPCIKL